ncbi:MAG: MFS transporter [Deltaproteobacteria bacterium]|nr:MFS transporter [Deltaproteobacteria bacterium]
MRHRAVGIIIAGFFTLFAAFGIRYAYGIILPYMLSSLSISKTSAGIIYSSYFITYTIFSPVLGLLGDRSNTKILVTVFVSILAAGAYLMSFSATVLQASIFFGLAGIGHSACWAPVVALVMRWVDENRRGMAVSIVDLGSAAGIAVWSAIIPLIIVASGWRMVWISLGMFTFLIAVMNLVLMKSHPPPETDFQKPATIPAVRIPIKLGYMAIFKDIKFYLIGFSYLLISFSILIPFTFLITYASQELMIPYKTATGLVVVIAISGAVCKLILGHYSDVVGRVRVMMLCGVLAGTGCLGMAYVNDYSILLLFSIIFGAGYGTIWPVYAASARDLFSRDYAGSVIGLWTCYHGIGSVLSPVIAGWLIDITGNYFWTFILGVMTSALSLILLLPVEVAVHKKGAGA